MLLQHSLLLAGEADDHRGHQPLGQHILFPVSLHEPLVIDFLMCRMLVNDQQSVFIRDQPVSIEDLSDQFKMFSGRFRQNLICEHFHLDRLQ